MGRGEGVKEQVVGKMMKQIKDDVGEFCQMKSI
jgi:hypothetical protein